MREMIDELKAIPGVVGASIYSSSDGLQVTNLPAIFKPERLNAVGKHLSKLYSAGRLSFSDLTDITLNYDESVVVARELEKNLLVFAFCDPAFNHNLLSMSFNLMQEDYRAGSFRTENHQTQAAPKAEKTGSVNSGIENIIEVMRDRLSKVLGPMANFIFDEVVDDWQKQGATDASRLDELIMALDQEIADEEKINRYRQLIAPELRTFREG